MNKKISLITAFVIFIIPHNIFCQNNREQAETFDEQLKIFQEDLLLERNSGKSVGTSTEGFNLYIRKKTGIESVMLAETTRDPEGIEHSYAFRAENYNSLNGDEIRYLDGEKLESKYSRYSLISSTSVNHSKLGECFLVYIPPKIIYGYPWGRNGSVEISDGTFINIRTFEKKYGDYTGKFADNPFMFHFPKNIEENEPQKNSTETHVTLTDNYNREAFESFQDISSNGTFLESRGPETLPEDIMRILEQLDEKQDADIIFAIDTTGSMKDDLESLKGRWIPELHRMMENFESARLGLVFYRDYNDSYNFHGLPVKTFNFTQDMSLFEKNLSSITIRGIEGGDVPEAVYEALYAGLTYFDWRDDAQKIIILVGDAAPHARPRGAKKISRELVENLAEKEDIKINCIIVPDKQKL